MRIGYFDCFAGASGDMILGALVDAGLSPDALTTELAKLPLAGYRISAQPAQRGAIAGTQVTVSPDEPGLTPEPRSWRQIQELIAASSLSPSVKERAASVFQRLASAEAKVHRVPIEEVHFHEVGAVDAIIDIVGTAIGLELLAVEAIFSSPLPVGSGVATCEHGLLPVPAPATLELVAMAGAPLRASTASDVAGEVLTPTGAAIITTLASFERPSLVLERIGYGAGASDPPTLPNVLALWLGQQVASAGEPELLLIETNIDDMAPELYGYVLERLLAQGARDVWFTPIQMKKNRPATMLSVLAPTEVEGAMVETILRETSTFGLRIQDIRRHEAERQVLKFQSSLGQVAVKVKRLGGAVLGLAPEFEDCRQLALEHGLPLQEVYRLVTAEANARLLPHG